MAENESTEEQPIQEAPPEEEPEVTEVEPSQSTEVAETEATEAEPEPEGTEEVAAEEPKPSRREQLRVRDLLNKYGPPEVKPDSIGGLDYEKTLDADPEVIAQLEADRRKVAETQYLHGLEQAKAIQFHTRLEIDVPKVESKYPQFDKNSPNFDADTLSEVNDLYLLLTGYDAKTDTVQTPMRYAEFVDWQMSLSDKLAAKKVQETSVNIAKQAATTGLRPDGSSAKRLNLNKAPEQMSDEELDAVIAQMPKSVR